MPFCLEDVFEDAFSADAFSPRLSPWPTKPSDGEVVDMCREHTPFYHAGAYDEAGAYIALDATLKQLEGGTPALPNPLGEPSVGKKPPIGTLSKARLLTPPRLLAPPHRTPE